MPANTEFSKSESILTTLPTELLLPIFKCLGKEIRDLYQLSSSCRFLRMLVLNGDYGEHWRNIHINARDKQSFARRISLAREMDNLEISEEPQHPTTLCENVLTKTGNHVRWLTLENPDECDIIQVVKHCRSLESLNFKNCNEPIPPLSYLIPASLANAFSTLTYFELSPLSQGSLRDMTSIFLNDLITQCPNLEQLHFVPNFLIPPSLFIDIPNRLPNLSELSLSSCRLIPDRVMKMFLSHHNIRNGLKYLALMDAMSLQDEAFVGLSDPLSDPTEIDSSPDPRPTPIVLQTLVIHYAPQMTDRAFSTSLTNCLSLKNVKYYNCPRLSLGALYKFGFDNVRDIDVRIVPKLPLGLGLSWKR